MKGRSLGALALVFLGLALPASASATPRLFDPDHPYFVPDAPAPPSIPDLTHRGLWLGLESTGASVKPQDVDGISPPRSFAFLGRLEAEYTLSRRRWYLGIAEEFAYGRPPTSDDGHFLYGNPELWIRAVWASPTGLAYGGGLAFVAPLFRQDPDSPQAAAAQAVRVVRPWQFASFAENTFTVRPYLDARVVDGPVIFQFRQGFEFQGIVAEAAIPQTSLVSRTTAYVGYHPFQLLGAGVELWEVYFVSAPDVEDDSRAVFAISPSVRMMTRHFQPSLSAIFPYETPLFDQAKSYWGMRLTLNFILETGEDPF